MFRRESHRKPQPAVGRRRRGWTFAHAAWPALLCLWLLPAGSSFAASSDEDAIEAYWRRFGANGAATASDPTPTPRLPGQAPVGGVPLEHNRPGAPVGVPLERYRDEQGRVLARVKETPEPELLGPVMRAPNGEPIAGLVEDRYITVAQLNRRVELYMRAVPDRLETPRQRAIRRDAYARRLLEEWAESTSLAVLAARKGYTASEEDLQIALGELATLGHLDPDKTQQLSMVGVPREELEQELRDGLIVERYVRDRVDASFPEQALREIFAWRPYMFLEPTKVRAWQVFRPRVGRMTRSQQEQAEEELRTWRNRLRRCDDEREFAELARETERLRTVTAIDMEWVPESASLPTAMLEALFTLDPGDTSDVFKTELGLHAVKVVERREGENSFENARERIKDYLFDKTKETLYVRAREAYRIRLDPEGVRRPMDAVAGPSPTPTPPPGPIEPEPSLDALRPGPAASPDARPDPFDRPLVIEDLPRGVE